MHQTVTCNQHSQFLFSFRSGCRIYTWTNILKITEEEQFQRTHEQNMTTPSFLQYGFQKKTTMFRLINPCTRILGVNRNCKGNRESCLVELYSGLDWRSTNGACMKILSTVATRLSTSLKKENTVSKMGKIRGMVLSFLILLLSNYDIPYIELSKQSKSVKAIYLMSTTKSHVLRITKANGANLSMTTRKYQHH